MSTGTYRGQVDRLKHEVANLERKAAEERSRATRERGEALRVRSSISRSTSETMLRSKLSDMQRRENEAIRHEMQAARYGEQVTAKTRQLRSAEDGLARAEDQQRRKDDADLRRRREDELRHIQRLEMSRRALQADSPPYETLRTPLQAAKRPLSEREYDVCLTFAGEQRGYVELVARGLKDNGLRVFYDEDEKIKLWGKDLVEHFDYVYRQASRYCVMFISAEYAAKPWTRQERRSALARALVEEGEYILPARFDDTELPGLPPTTAYLDLAEIAPATLVEAIVEKLEMRG